MSRKAIGKHVFITTYEPISGAKEFEGLLLSFDGENAVVRYRQEGIYDSLCQSSKRKARYRVLNIRFLY